MAPKLKKAGIFGRGHAARTVGRGAPTLSRMAGSSAASTSTNKSEMNGTDKVAPMDSSKSTVTLEDIKLEMRCFAAARDWDQFHSPRNLLLALVGEVGELSEIFQWRGEVPAGLAGWSEKDKTHLGEELSDVLLYLVRLADKCDIDLGRAVLAKMSKNAAKYPADLVRGSSKKYTEYKQTHRAATAAAAAADAADAAVNEGDDNAKPSPLASSQPTTPKITQGPASTTKKISSLRVDRAVDGMGTGGLDADGQLMSPRIKAALSPRMRSELDQGGRADVRKNLDEIRKKRERLGSLKRPAKKAAGTDGGMRLVEEFDESVGADDRVVGGEENEAAGGGRAKRSRQSSKQENKAQQQGPTKWV